MRGAFPAADEVEGIVRQNIAFESDGFSVPALLVAREDAADSRSPALVIGQEAWGLTDHIVDVAANLAAEGWICIVPDYFARSGGPGADAEKNADVESVHRAVDRLDNVAIARDMRAAFNWIAGDPRVDPARIGTIGFCTGGTYSMILAIEEPRLACAALYYVSQLRYPINDAKKPWNPIDRAASIRCPTQVVFGQQDKAWTDGWVSELEQRLRTAGNAPEMITPAGGGHAFLSPTWRGFHDASAREAWPRTLAFLRSVLAR